jgi:hypothetical protein
MIVDKYGNYVRKFMWQLCTKIYVATLSYPTQLPYKFSYIVAILIHNHHPIHIINYAYTIFTEVLKDDNVVL